MAVGRPAAARSGGPDRCAHSQAVVRPLSPVGLGDAGWQPGHRAAHTVQKRRCFLWAHPPGASPYDGEHRSPRGEVLDFSTPGSWLPAQTGPLTLGSGLPLSGHRVPGCADQDAGRHVSLGRKTGGRELSHETHDSERLGPGNHYPDGNRRRGHDGGELYCPSHRTGGPDHRKEVRIPAGLGDPGRKASRS